MGEVLRPLNLGEILDRAVTLFVRNFPAFATIGLVYIVPLTVMQFFISQSSAGSYQQLIDQIQHPGRVPPASLSSFPWGWLIASFAYTSVCTPFVVGAYAVAVRAIYRGSRPEWRAAYGPGLARAPLVLVTELLSAIVLGIFGGFFGFALGIAFTVIILLVRASAAAAIVLSIVTAIALAAVLLLFGVLYLALWFAIFAVVVEGADVGSALSTGFRRIFARPELGRASLLCLCFFAVYLGNFLVSGGVSVLLDGVVRMRVLDTIAQGVLQLCFLGFFATLLAVYYFDVRVRREGLDIQTGLDELDAPPAT